MIGAYGTLKIFNGRTKRGASVFVFLLGSKGATQIQISLTYDARERTWRALGFQ